MSTKDPDEPKPQRVQVTEEVPAENEMFRGKRRTVTLPLDGASDANLREFYQKLEDSERIDTAFAHKLISDLAAIEAKLDELGYPPPRGRYIVQDDHWGALPEDWNLSLAEEHGARSQVVDPAAPYGIETGSDYIKRRAEVFSLPWWLGHLGYLLIRILSETDLNRALNLTLQYGGDRQRYRDQFAHLENSILGRERREHNREIGRRSKRRRWADILAKQVTSWEEIPDSSDPLEIETLEADLRIYRDGKNVICVIDGREKKLARSTFEKNYLRPALRQRGQ